MKLSIASRPPNRVGPTTPTLHPPPNYRRIYALSCPHCAEKRRTWEGLIAHLKYRHGSV